MAIKLWEDARNCEHSAEAAILAAPLADKFSAFYSGFDEWGDKFSASITEYYKNCFVIARRNRVQHNYLLSLGKISSTDKFRNPAEFAKVLTEGEISAFLRVTSLDREEPAQEIGSGGRVREFVRHACEDYTDGQNTVFRLPQWFGAKWNAKAQMAKLEWREPGSAARTLTIDKSSTLSAEETEKFVLGMEEMLIRKLRVAIADAHRKALIILGKIGTATAVPSETDVGAASSSQKKHTGPTISKRSNKVCLRKGVIFRAIGAGKTGLDYCGFLRDNGLTTPESWRADGCPDNYSLAYQRPGRLGRKWRGLIYKEKNRNATLHSKLMHEYPAELRRILNISRIPSP